MNYRIVLTSALVLALLLAVTGCLSTEPPAVTTAPTTVSTPVPTTTPTPVPTTKASTVPGPTEALPAGWDLSVTVEKSGLYSRTIIAKFDGGKGLMYASRMDVRVTLPDGTIRADGITRPKMGDTVEILGSEGADRVEVIMQMADGGSYKIIDQQMPFKAR
jgi:hypothetical protein